MTTNAHTPTPWVVEKNEGRFNLWGGSSHEFLAADCGVASNQWAKGNADLIVRAVNAHEGLAAALQALPTEWLNSGVLSSNDKRIDHVPIKMFIEGTTYEAEMTVGDLRRARAALAKLEAAS